MNKVILIGNVGNVEFKSIGNGMLTFSLATEQRWKDKDGQKQKKTDWHSCTVHGKHGEVLKDMVHKGDRLGVVGRISYNKSDKNGETRTYTNIDVLEVELLGGKKRDEPQSNKSDDVDELPE